MIRKSIVRLVGGWSASTSLAFISALVENLSWRVALALLLMILRSLSQGAQLLLLVPIMQLVGLDMGQGSVDWLAQAIRHVFEVVNVTPTPVNVLGCFVFSTIVLATVTRWQIVSNYRMQRDFVDVLRRRLYRAIANADWLTLSRSRPSDFTHALTTELERVGTATGFLLQLLTNLVLVSIYVGFALRLSAIMTALVFISGAGLLLLLRRKTLNARTLGEEVSRATNGLYSAAIEHLGGMKIVKSYGAEERSTDGFSKMTEGATRAYLKSVRNYAETGFWFSVGSVVILSTILLVSLELLKLSAAGLVLLLFLFSRTIPLFNGIQQSFQQYLNALPAFAGVMQMQTRCEAAAEPEPGQTKQAQLRYEVRLERVCFGYEEKALAIRDLNLVIEAEKTTAIVGPSGAGKSTTADLVMGLLTPDSGKVIVDGSPLTAGQVRSWRDQISYVAQDTFLFNDTVRANLLWACPGASDEEINWALSTAAAEELVSQLPNGVETVLGDRGVRLSGGERQRLALARALLRRPSLLILDEATSALDSENEERIQNAIEELHGSLTILVITHRLSTIRNADVIHVLEQGLLVETGDWESLLGKQDGRFRALCRAQGIGTNGERPHASGARTIALAQAEPEASAGSLNHTDPGLLGEYRDPRAEQ